KTGEETLFAPADILRALRIDGTSCFARTKAGWTLLRPGEDAKPLAFDDVQSAGQGLYRAQQNGLWGLVDDEGDLIAPCAYDEIGYFPEAGLAWVRQGEKYGYIDKAGTLAIPCAFDYAGDFRDGLAPALQGGVCGAIDSKGKWRFTLDAPVQDARRETVGFAVQRDEKWGFVSLEGKWIANCVWDDIQVSPSGLIGVQSAEGYGLLDASGETLLPCKYRQIAVLRSKSDASYDDLSFLSVCSGDKWGIYSLQDKKWLLPCEYESVSQYSKSYGYSEVAGYALLRSEGRIGLYDLKREEMLLPCQYDDVAVMLSSAEQSCAVLIMDGKSGLFDLDRKQFVLPCAYKTLGRAGEKLIVTEQSGEDGSVYGLCGFDGREILPCIYKSIQFSEGYVTALENGYYIILNENGERTF
ncbi:MAG: WG repeat-containing protein, partial [Clostridia bacterium]|nr:WG repeat-containing protein [Clostridia bacterium]